MLIYYIFPRILNLFINFAVLCAPIVGRWVCADVDTSHVDGDGVCVHVCLFP